MIRRIVTIIVFFFAYLNQYGQFKIANDKDFKNYSDNFIQYASIQNPDFEKSDFEMRLWIIRHVNQPHAVFVFKHSKVGKWTVKSYIFCTTDWLVFSGLNDEIVELSQYWNSRWDSLIRNQILQLPSESKVLKKWGSSTGIIPVIADGLSYRIELFTENKRRRYSYNNPEDKLPNYDLNNKELVAVNKIIAILNSELQFKQKLNNECH